MKTEPREYWAFISYSQRDEKWGKWLLKEIETYPIPAALVGQDTNRGYKIPKKLYPIFRDRDELPTAANFGEMLENALKGS